MYVDGGSEYGKSFRQRPMEEEPAIRSVTNPPGNPNAGGGPYESGAAALRRCLQIQLALRVATQKAHLSPENFLKDGYQG